MQQCAIDESLQAMIGHNELSLIACWGQGLMLLMQLVKFIYHTTEVIEGQCQQYNVAQYSTTAGSTVILFHKGSTIGLESLCL